MGFHRGPKIVTDGLVLYLDAANTRSYPGTGTAWANLSKSTSIGTLTNGPIFSPNNGGSILFDGIDDRVTIDTGYTFSSNENYSYEVWFNPTTNNTTSGLIGGTNNPMIRWGQGSAKPYLFVGWSESPFYLGNVSNSILAVNKWHHVVGTIDHIGKIGRLYVNGIFETQFTWNTGTVNVPPRNIYFNQRDSSNAYLGAISVGKVYNRALTAQEILQNYNATKSRYGL
jgi:hypothetical protein